LAPEDAQRPALQIIVDDNPAPIGPLLEVLPGDAAAKEIQPLRPAPNAEPVAPRRPAAGLMKVDTVVAPEPLLVPAVKIEEKPKPKAAPKPAPEPKVVKAPEKPKVQKAKAEPKPKAEKLTVAEAKSAKVEKAKAAKAAKLAEVEKARAEKLARADKAAKAKAEKAKAAKLAQIEAKTQKAAKAQAETRRLASLVKAVKATPRKLKAEVAKTTEIAKAKAVARKKTVLAQAKPAKTPRVEKASIKPVVVAKPRPPAPKKLVIPRGEGPMRVARNEACASADPGETAVCSDRRLGARDRQLQQAYRNAEALRRQQDRWLHARAAAAREAPWAVEDVYEARISELNDLTRDAREN
jgi:hypothetical protein